MKTQGTNLWVIDPDDDSLLNIGCVTSIDGVASTRATTTIPPCLSDPSGAAGKSPGELTPGTPTFGINTNPADASHIRLHELLISGDVVKFALGWSDGTAPPTVDTSGDFDLPNTRTWLTFPGYISTFPFSFASNAVVASTIGVEMTSPELLVPKA